MHDLLTVKQAAKLLGVSPQLVYLQIQAGLLAHVRVGTRTIRIEQADLDAYLASGHQPANERTARLLGRARVKPIDLSPR
ncbi:MAG TPA: helix-turn-helix domain-containing protein [bacterium]|nr:helix-turn-helix domain-containing protein [bacterium]